jgi:hypothetical protein
VGTRAGLDVCITPWGRTLPEKLKVTQLVRKFRAFKGPEG